jgi:hypothetical protein
MDEENVLYIHKGILVSYKEEKLLKFAAKWMSQKITQ